MWPAVLGREERHRERGTRAVKEFLLSIPYDEDSELLKKKISKRNLGEMLLRTS